MPEPRHSPNATARAPSRYADHKAAVTTADDNEIGRSPGAQPRGPRPGFAAEGPATATSRSRANESVNATARSHPSDLSERKAPFAAPGSDKSTGLEGSANRSQPKALIAASGSDKSTGAAGSDNTADAAGSADGKRKPDVSILLGTVDLA